jgi:acyl-CoA reductase-like NAD-dependent aldehyde dehydrogenase
MPELKSINPADGSVLGSVKIATKADVEQAIIISKKAFLSWRDIPLVKRAQIIAKVGPLLKKNSPKLAQLIAKEMGKPLVEGEGEIALTIDYIKYYSEEAQKIYKDELLKKDGLATSLLRYDPYGVVLLIKPWNFPVLTPFLSLIPALLAGNSVIFKPSEYVPLVSQFLVDLLWQAGVPKDVLQILQGRAQIGQMLVDSPIDMVSFTGSTAVGQEIAQKCAARLIKFNLELGGSSAAIVARDADLELAANAILFGRYSNAGQDCLAIKRVFVERAAYNKLIKLLVPKVKALRVGNPLEKNVDMGPLASEEQLKRFQNQVTRGVVQSGRIIVGGRQLRTEPYIKGYFHEPTLMINVNAKMEVMQQEVFGPMLPVCEVENFKQGIKLANNTSFGLTGVVFTRSKENIAMAQKELEAGTVYVNDTGIFYPNVPYEGIKMSGFGVESGRFGMWEFVHKKHLHVNLSKQKTRDYWFPY